MNNYIEFRETVRKNIALVGYQNKDWFIDKWLTARNGN